MALDANLGIGVFDTVTELGQICNRLGLDHISAGNAVTWAIRKNKADLIDESFTVGAPDVAKRFLHGIAFRSTALSDRLADDTKVAPPSSAPLT